MWQSLQLGFGKTGFTMQFYLFQPLHLPAVYLEASVAMADSPDIVPLVWQGQGPCHHGRLE